MTDSTGLQQADYEDLYKRLAREILKHEGRIEGDAGQFVTRLVKKLPAEGRQITPAVQADLTDYLTAMQASIKVGITSAATLAAGTLPAIEQSALVARLAEEAYAERWPDGLRLSDRLWKWQDNVKTGLTQVVQDGIKAGESVDKTLYAMQRTIERTHGGQRFKIVENYADDWVKELHEAALDLIHDPTDRVYWDKVVGEAEDRILELKATGSRHGAERVLDQMKKAVLKGKGELADKAAKWWLYDKQLYHLKRIARTEMATALHKAVIASVEGDASIIGFQWRLSASHPVTDICDYYANIEMGLGKGVFTREAVPAHKAHPHCVLGDTVIDSPGAIVAATKSFYQGGVVEITTRNARRLTCTLNHSILTRDGWVEAQFINKGQQIITAADSKPGTLYPNDNDMPASIEDIFNALLESGRMTSSAVPVAAEHFHGDGRGMDGNIEIVHVDGFLLGDSDAGISEHPSETGFFAGDLVPDGFSNGGGFDSLLDASGFSPDSVMSVGGYSLPECLGSPAHIEGLAFIGRPDKNIILSEQAVDNASGNSAFMGEDFGGIPGNITGNDAGPIRDTYFSTHINISGSEGLVEGLIVDLFASGKALYGFSGTIALDEIVDIRKRDFSGFVYDLQVNPQHWYFANGIVTHNCMCLLIPRVTAIKQKGSKNYADFINNMPEPKRNELLPKWLRNVNSLGAPIDKLIRPDGLGPITREALKEKMGAQEFGAVNALGKAKAVKDWGTRTFKSGRMTRQTLSEFAPFDHIPEVKKLVGDIEAGNPIDGSRLKYLKRKYPDGESIGSHEEINSWFSAVMNDADATIRARPNEASRYAVHSVRHQLTAIMDKSGQRITVYTDDGSKLEPVWLTLSGLIKTIH